MPNIGQRWWILPSAVALAWCVGAACGGSAGGGGDTGGKPDGGTTLQCKPTNPTSCPSQQLHYADVKPIIDARCVHCHYEGATEPDGTGRWPLTTYAHVADWFDIIPGQILTCQMPPSDAGIPITNDERNKILTWLHCGFPQ
jgi:uncharacterized membrane protein